MLGMKSADEQGEGPAKKRTKVATNSRAIAAALEHYQCDGLHRHVILEGGRPKAFEKYPDEFCKVVLEAFNSETTAVLNMDEFGEPSGKPCRASWDASMPDERSTRLPEEWQHTMDVTHTVSHLACTFFRMYMPYVRIRMYIRIMYYAVYVQHAQAIGA